METQIKEKPIVSKDWLRERVQGSNGNMVVGRALLAIFRRQSLSEKQSSTTIERNGVGFSSCDAFLGTLTVKLFLNYGNVPPNLYKAWTKIGKNGYPRICRYADQLNQIAQSNPN